MDDSCDAGNVHSCVMLARAYSDGSYKLGVNTDPKTAARYYAYACQRDDAESCHALAKLYREGKLSDPDGTLGSTLLARACQLGSTAGCTDLEAHPPTLPPATNRRWPAWFFEKPVMPVAKMRGKELPATHLFKQAAPSVYLVTVIGTDESVSGGSAVAVSPHHLLTNCHVLESPGIIFVSQKGEVGVVTLQAADHETDRCWLYSGLIHFNPVAGIRSFDSLEVGETVYSLGAPKRLEATLASGMISGKPESHVVQTTAPISRGSSGGALFDSRANLVGITTKFLPDAQALNFCVSAEALWQ